MKLKYEIIQRVVGEIEVDEQTYSNETLDVEEAVEMTLMERGKLALQKEMEKDESEIWDMFADEIGSVGPDGVYFKMCLLDGEADGDDTASEIHAEQEHSISYAHDVRPAL